MNTFSPTSRLLGVAGLAVTLLASSCGDDSADSGDAATTSAAHATFPAATSCGLALDTSGALAAHTATSSPIACLTQHSSGTGIDSGFIPTDKQAELEAAQVTVRQVAKGETGGPYLTTLTLRHHDKRLWQSDECHATITGNSDVGPAQLGESYRVTGTVTCPTLEMRGDAGADGGIELHGLSFVTTITWDN